VSDCDGDIPRLQHELVEMQDHAEKWLKQRDASFDREEAAHIEIGELRGLLESLTCYELFRRLPEDFQKRVKQAIFVEPT
jgi:hypothetical protein